jgi:AAT family amino acid transporter
LWISATSYFLFFFLDFDVHTKKENKLLSQAETTSELSDQHSLKRHLKARHIRLMALGSTIGVGLFLGSGTAISQAGPSILLGYLLSGIIAFIVLRALGEMAVYNPVAGSFAQYAHDYVGPLAGYLVGWGYWFYWVIVGVAEVTAVGIYMGLWFPDIPQWIWAVGSLILMGGLNFIAVRLFGEFEFWFALIKVVAIIAMISIGFGVIFFGLGNDGVAIGISNLWAHGGFFPTGLDGFLLSLQMAIFAYVGIEMIGLSAGETENPEKTIPIAIDSLIVRILVFYGGALFVILSIYPWNEVGQVGSPFVAMFEKLGLREAAGIVNFVVITAALSSCNAGIFSGGRLLYGLSINSYAPSVMKKISRTGVPYIAILTTVSIASLGAFLNYFVPDEAFLLVTSAVTFIGLMVWIAILSTQLMFRKKINAEDVASLKYKSFLYPYGSWIALAAITFVLVLLAIQEQTRVGVYVGVPIVLILIIVFYLVGLHRHDKHLGEKK